MFLKGILGSSENRVRPKLIQYSFPDNSQLVHKESGYPILQDSQLIVGPSQTVLMVRNGQIYKEFKAGAQVLDTGVLLSVLQTYEKTYDGGENGVPVDLYFINNLYSDVLPWGTPDPIQILDPVLDILIKVSANGQLRYQIVDPQLYILTNLSADVEDLNRICKQKALANFASTVQSFVQTEKLGYFELAAQIVKVSDRLRDLLNAKLVGEEGFRITEFTVSGFHANDEDLATLQEAKNDVLKAKARARARSVEGYTYQEERRFDVMQDAASNTGNLGGMMGTMVGATLGMNMGNEIGNKMSQQTFQQPSAAPSGAGAPNIGIGIGVAVCPSCGAELAPGSKFCSKCGSAVPSEKFCSQCGTKLSADAAFCHACGARQG